MPQVPTMAPSSSRRGTLVVETRVMRPSGKFSPLQFAYYGSTPVERTLLLIGEGVLGVFG